MAKWGYLKSRYPKVPLDSSYQDKVAAILDSTAPSSVLGPDSSWASVGFRVRDLSDFQLAKLYDQARQAKEDLENRVSILTLEIEAYSRLLVDRFEDAGETKKTFEGGMTLSISDTPLAVVTDRDKLMEWAKANLPGGTMDLMMFSAGKMSSLVKSSLDEGTPLPNGVDVYMKTSITRRGAGKTNKGEENNE